MDLLRRTYIFGLVLVVVLAAGVVAPPAQAAVSQEAAAKRIAEAYNVEVLEARADERDGRKVWLVTIMVPAGHGNSAFQVHVLAVDQETGDLVSSFRNHTGDYSLPPPAPGADR